MTPGAAANIEHAALRFVTYCPHYTVDHFFGLEFIAILIHHGVIRFCEPIFVPRHRPEQEV
jgi:hypothetical protein